jgi:hypothetical protein
MGISVRFTRRTFFILDKGLFVSLCGRELAWTRACGWVRGRAHTT